MDGKDSRPGQSHAGWSPATRALLEERLRQKLRSGAAVQEIPRLPDRHTAPLSFIQERVWFLQQLQPQDPVYNRPVALKLTGPLNLLALQQALNEILRRHEVLRTIFPSREGKPVQTVVADAVWPLAVTDLGELPLSEGGSEARKLAIEAARKTFDLAQGPLVRAFLCRLDPEEHLLLLVIHHIAFDAWSVRVLLKEMATLYEALAAGRPALLPDLPIQYADFAEWQRGWVQQKLENHLSYWQEQLSGLPVLDLPVDHPRPAMQTFRGGTESLVLPPDLAESLMALSRRENATLFMTLLAAFQTLLCRYTGKEDIVVGSLTSGRDRLETEELIGCFLNTITLRTDLTGEPGFREVLARVRNVCLEAYNHQELPFEKLMKALQPERDLSRTPFFQVMFNLENFPEPTLETGSIRFEQLEVDWGMAPYDLTLEIIKKNQTLQVLFVYNADLFEAATIRRLSGHFHTLLAGIAAHPDRPITLLPLLTETERHQVLVEWNATKTAYPRDRCLHELFEAQAERSPDALAASCGEDAITYAQLNSRANQTAHYLQRLGVGPEAPVGLCVEPSVEMLVAVLGILKAGGCYVPLDPEYPGERLAWLLSDTRAGVLLTQEKFKAGLPGGGPLTICLDVDHGAISRESTKGVDSGTAPENLACIFYTSGSTGRPKGVAVSHYAVNRLVLNTNYINFQPSDRIAQAANISFDGATFEIWGALLNGGSLVIVPKDVLVSSMDLARFIREERITVLFLTPALFHQVAREAPGAFGSVRDLIMGGEVLEPRWVRKVMQQGPPMRLLNGYGPTESTTFATCYQVPDLPAESRAIPIGRPLANTTVYILDRHLQPVPVGVAGELYIGGDGLARGYFNQPEQTAEKFIPHPFSDEPGARLYRTGDLARYLPDGNIDFLGRIDHQVKIRGFRVEPGEIEAVLLSHPGVQEALVMARVVEPGDKRLVAYVVLSPESSPTADNLQDFLRGRLPLYMVPASYIFLDKFPLNPNGKVDRLALSALSAEQGSSARVYVAPGDDLERRLVEVWEAVLKVSPIGVHDNFFALGGHSLLGAQLFTRIEKIFGQKISLTLLYQRPTIAQLAEILPRPELVASVGSSPLVAINSSGSKPPFFWIKGKDGLPAIQRSLTNDQPLFYLESPDDLDQNFFSHSTIEKVAADYLKQIRQVQTDGPYFLGGVCIGSLIAGEIARQLGGQGSRVGLVFLLDPPPLGGSPPLIGLPLARHLEKLTPLGWRDKLRYGLNIVKSLFLKIMYKALAKTGGVFYPIFPFMGYRAALRDYRPRFSADSTVLVQCKKGLQGNHFDWPRVIQGRLEMHAIDGYHASILEKGHVQVWVAYLQKYLQEAQARAFLAKQ